jgi:hypothetical protein
MLACGNIYWFDPVNVAVSGVGRLLITDNADNRTRAIPLTSARRTRPG